MGQLSHHIFPLHRPHPGRWGPHRTCWRGPRTRFRCRSSWWRGTGSCSTGCRSPAWRRASPCQSSSLRQNCHRSLACRHTGNSGNGRVVHNIYAIIFVTKYFGWNYFRNKIFLPELFSLQQNIFAGIIFVATKYFCRNYFHNKIFLPELFSQQNIFAGIIFATKYFCRNYFRNKIFLPELFSQQNIFAKDAEQ